MALTRGGGKGAGGRRKERALSNPKEEEAAGGRRGKEREEKKKTNFLCQDTRGRRVRCRLPRSAKGERKRFLSSPVSNREQNAGSLAGGTSSIGHGVANFALSVCVCGKSWDKSLEILAQSAKQLVQVGLPVFTKVFCDEAEEELA